MGINKKINCISLIGMPGSGKTSLGALLAKRLGWSFFDMDDYIVSISGQSIEELFAQSEAVFREWEAKACQELALREKTVIACGGGIVLNMENIRHLKNQGLVIFIDRPLSNIASDIDIGSRPLLKEAGLNKLKILYQQRYGLYQKATKLHINNNGSLVEGLDKLLQTIKIENNKGGCYEANCH